MTFATTRRGDSGEYTKLWLTPISRASFSSNGPWGLQTTGDKKKIRRSWKISPGGTRYWTMVLPAEISVLSYGLIEAHCHPSSSPKSRVVVGKRNCNAWRKRQESALHERYIERMWRWQCGDDDNVTMTMPHASSTWVRKKKSVQFVVGRPRRDTHKIWSVSSWTVRH